MSEEHDKLQQFNIIQHATAPEDVMQIGHADQVNIENCFISSGYALPLPLRTNSIRWEKVAALWWLCSDSYDAFLALCFGAPPATYFDLLDRTANHARELNLGPDTLNILEDMAEFAHHASENDWTPQKREECANKVRSVFHGIADKAKEFQNQHGEFRPDPPRRG
ncbi:MAG: hypothetical protein JW910_06150 [Anaerolineae bacterium]|nr:hypothetical protein [Anaerolineae bacterium]